MNSNDTPPLNLLFVTNAYPDGPKSNRGWFIRELAQKLGCAGHRVDILTEKVFSRSTDSEEEPFGRVLRVANPFSRERLLADVRGFPLKRLFHLIARETKEGFRLCRSEKVDLIHAHWAAPSGLSAALISFLAARPFVLSIHGTDVTRFAGHPIAWPVIRQVVRRAHRVVCNSSFTAGYIRDLGVPDSRIDVLPCIGVDTDRFHPADNLHMEGAVLFVGNLTLQKRPDVLLEAFTRVSKAFPGKRLLFVGDGPQRKKLEERAGHLGIENRVSFLGAVPNAELPRIYRKAHVLVLPSEKEGLGQVVMEAMACGLPVLASRDGGIPDLVKNGETGFLFNPGDIGALAGYLKNLLKDPEKAIRFGIRARRTAVSEFHGSNVIERYQSVYRDALKG